jgi:ribosome biogenesis GTPase
VKADWERYPYYFQLLDEIRIREEFQLRTFGTKREGDVRYVRLYMEHVSCEFFIS